MSKSNVMCQVPGRTSGNINSKILSAMLRLGSLKSQEFTKQNGVIMILVTNPYGQCLGQDYCFFPKKKRLCATDFQKCALTIGHLINNQESLDGSCGGWAATNPSVNFYVACSSAQLTYTQEVAVCRATFLGLQNWLECRKQALADIKLQKAKDEQDNQLWDKDFQAACNSVLPFSNKNE